MRTVRLGVVVAFPGGRRPRPAARRCASPLKNIEHSYTPAENCLFFDIEIFTRRRHAQHVPQIKLERRGLVRRSRQHSLWITIENDIRNHECKVLDVSANGAKLLADIDVSVGSKLCLSIVPHAIVRRECEVVWRKGRMIGVKFADGAAKSE
jgi:hypothetical protein